MKKFSSLVALGALALMPLAAHADDAAGLAGAKGKMLYTAAGQRLGSIYKVMTDGSAQLILDGRMITVPANTLTMADGKVQTSLTKNQVISQ